MSPLPRLNRWLIHPFLSAHLLHAIIAAAFATNYHTVHAASILHVNDDVSGGSGNGSSWANAFPTLQDAIAAATAGDQIWVAKGVYYPDEGSGQTNNNPSSTFPLKSGVAVYGGFAGTENQLSQRNIAANPTVLSGDVEKDDATNADKVVTNSAFIIGTNAAHVVTAVFSNNVTRLDGFIITGGSAVTSGNSCPTDCGGGYLGDSSEATLTNLTFQGNRAKYGGGAILYGAVTPTLSKLTFINNKADHTNNTGGAGGGLDVREGAKPTLSELTFTGNSAYYDGGGLFVYNAEVAINNAVFTSNSATDDIQGYGGGLYMNESATLSMTQATFDSNHANGLGGGLYNLGNVTLSHVTFSHNTIDSGYGGALFSRQGNLKLTSVSFIKNSSSGDDYYTGGALFSDRSNPILEDVLFEGNQALDSIGGAIVSFDDTLHLKNVVFKANAASAGILFIGGRETTLTNVAFIANKANGGSAVMMGNEPDHESKSVFTNVTITGNSGEVINSFITGSQKNSIIFQNVVIWGNAPATFPDKPGYSYSYSLIEGKTPPGTGNLDGAQAANDPRFVAAINCGSNGCIDDLDTGVDESADNNYGDQNLQGNSPAIDSGNNSAKVNTFTLDSTTIADIPTDLAGNPRLARVTAASDIVDMGAYEHLNLPPVADAGGPYSLNEGNSLALDGSHSSDPDNPITSYAWDCTNNGNNEFTSANPTGNSCSYANDGSFTLKLTVVDTLGVSKSDTAQVTVTNVAPTLTPASNQSTVAGNAKSFTLGSFTDPGAEGTWQVTIDWGDATPVSQINAGAAGNLSKASHTYATAGSFNVFITVNDGKASDDGGFVVTVNAAQAGAPAVTPPADQSVAAGVGESFTLGSFSDANSSGPWQVTVDWGDNSAETSFSATAAGSLGAKNHTYVAAGGYTVLVSVNAGALSGSASFVVTVSAESNSGSVSGAVYADANGNSAQDVGEGVLGATISLVTAGQEKNQANTAAINLTRTATSDANGNYRLDNLPPDGYTLTLTPPSGYATQGANQQSITITSGETTAAPAFTLKPTGDGGSDNRLFLPGMYKPAK